MPCYVFRFALPNAHGTRAIVRHNAEYPSAETAVAAAWKVDSLSQEDVELDPAIEPFVVDAPNFHEAMTLLSRQAGGYPGLRLNSPQFEPGRPTLRDQAVRPKDVMYLSTREN